MYGLDCEQLVSAKKYFLSVRYEYHQGKGETNI